VLVKLVEKFRHHVFHRYRSELRQNRSMAVVKRQKLINMLLANDRMLKEDLRLLLPVTGSKDSSSSSSQDVFSSISEILKFFMFVLRFLKEIVNELN